MNVYASTGFFAAVTLGAMAASQFTPPMQPRVSAHAHAQQRISTEVVQIGTATDSAAATRCLTYDVTAANHIKLADRFVTGAHFTQFLTSDSGMSQQAAADDLRARPCRPH